MSFIRLDVAIKEVDRNAAKQLARLHALCFPYPWSEQSFETFLENKFHRTMVAEIKGRDENTSGEYAGFVLIRSVAGEAEILSIAVAPEHQKTGIASSLLYQISELLRNERVKKIFLEVGQHNRVAQALYNKMGFTHVGDKKAYYKSGPGQPASDALIMEKIL